MEESYGENPCEFNHFHDFLYILQYFIGNDNGNEYALKFCFFWVCFPLPTDIPKF